MLRQVLSTYLALGLLSAPATAETCQKKWIAKQLNQVCDRPEEQETAAPKAKPQSPIQVTRVSPLGAATRAWRRQTKVRRTKPLPKYYSISMVGSYWEAEDLRLHFQQSSVGSIAHTDGADKPAAIQWGGYGGRIWVIVKEQSLAHCVISKRKGLFRLTCRNLAGQKRVALVLAQP